ncbi:MAG: hypothetical protein LAP39_08880 [Acidobacteriia bacterium]|nr:hypothetical protein [Terriglobia bacterium]
MLLERVSPLRLIDVEAALRRAVRRRRASIAAVEPAGSATVFTILQPELYGMLLAADARFAALLPCRIAAFAAGDGIKLAAVSPVRFASGFERVDLQALAASAESMLNDILDQAARPLTQAAAGGHAESGLGATEDQMNMRGAVPQRIDSRGSKVEELAGTGEQDSRGG